MAFNKNTEIKPTIDPDFDFVVDEKGNQFIALRKVAWSDGKEPRLELRKWINNPNGTEQAMKGTGFLTEEGPHTLTKVLCENGYGHTPDIINGIKDRDDFRLSLNKVLNPDDELYDPSAVGKDFFDPQELFGDNDE